MEDNSLVNVALRFTKTSLTRRSRHGDNDKTSEQTIFRELTLKTPLHRSPHQYLNRMTQKTKTPLQHINFKLSSK